MSNLRLHIIKSCMVPVVGFVVLISQASAGESATDSKATKREAIRDQRPDDSRGWMVVSKESYWPLCYESLVGSKRREA